MNRSRRTNFKKVVISLRCEWSDCEFYCEKMADFEEHVLNHLRLICNQNENNEIYCGICLDNLNKDLSSIRHMYYHAYHLELKARGKYIIRLLNLDSCSLDSGSSNVIPSLDQPFICQWENCDYSNDNVTAFYDHIEYHPIAEANNNILSKKYVCKWADCTYTSAISLQAHLPSHCEKRYIACPTCGLCFATTSKFTDHLKRQIVTVWKKQMQDQEMTEVLSTLANTYNPVIPIPKPVISPPKEAYKCNLCMHLFATKRLLKDHEVRHVSSLVCPHCHYTCPSRYALKRHILFRHTEEKPFICSECEMAFKCNDGLKRHTSSKHNEEVVLGVLQCDDPECAYTAKNRRCLNIHKSRTHCKLQTIVTKVFVCHKCDQEYVQGAKLTDHLTKEHGINKISNRCRHQYKVCEDGKYRLNMFDLKLKKVIKESNFEPESPSKDEIVEVLNVVD